MADNKEIDDILNEVKARKERLDNGENPFADEVKPEVSDEEVTINISEEPEGDDGLSDAVSSEEDDVISDKQDEAEETVEEAVEDAENDALIEESQEEAPADEETAEAVESEEGEDRFEIINDGEDIDMDYENELDEQETKAKKKKIMIISAVCLVIIIVIAGVLYAVFGRSKPEEPTTTAPTTAVSTTEKPVVIVNPLTGENEYNKSAIGKRPVACVVENSQPARPQWGIADEEHAPDIILQGEVEGGETRMLWFYADYTALPDQIGPTRSARPPYIRFSELFDAIFVHWGMSSTTSDYLGADSVFENDDVDHINQMTFSDSVGLYGRDSSRSVALEHTGVIYGAKMADAIESAEFRTDVDDSSFSKLTFNEKITKLSDTSCSALSLKYSSRSGSTNWTYGEDGLYHSSDYNTDVKRENLLVLFDNTTYVSKSNYKGSGSTEVYCDYGLDGGSGKLASNGTVIDITWSVENGLLVIKDANGKNATFNPGKTWIGWASDNNGGSVDITA